MMMRQRYCLLAVHAQKNKRRVYVYSRKNIDKTSDVMNANYCFEIYRNMVA